jgi:membrane-associated phospholipid phosphatase
VVRVTPDPAAESAATPLTSVRHEVASRTLVALIGALAGAAVWGTWRIFVGTYEGQLLDQAAFEGAEFGRNQLWRVAEPVLDVISVPFIAGVLAIAVVIALVRRRWLLAAQVALLIAGANASGQILKHAILERPDLDVADRLANTLPSGHTIAATSCAVALVLVAPRRWRAAVAAVGALYAAAIGVSTLIGAWHRPGDVVAGLLLVLAWTCVVRVLGPSGSVGTRADHKRESTAASMLLGLGVVAGGVAALALVRTLEALRQVEDQYHSTGLEERSDLLTAYVGGALGIVAVCAVVFGLVLVTLRVTEPRRAP